MVLNLAEVLPERERAIALLDEYFGLSGTRPYTGARFERLGGGGDAPAVADRITAEDIVALSMLSIRLPGRAARILLEDEEFIEGTRTHLHGLPTNLDLADADTDPLALGGPADLLWEHLWELPGVGATTVSKLMARKRPRLIPVWDSVIKRAFGLRGVAAQWQSWHELFAGDGKRVHQDMLALREEAGLPNEISALRVLDVVVWMEHHREPEEGDDVPALGE